ncbi:MAG: cache domain-containing sensor histidine kinase [Mobilitalea sp.]
MQQAEKNIFEHTDQMLNQVKTSIDVYISTIEKTSNYITKEMEDSSFFSVTQEEDNSWENEKTRILDLFHNIANTHPEVAGILVATENDMYISTGMTRISRDSFTEESWYKKAAENPNEIQIISDITGRNIVTNESYNVDNVFSLSKAIIDKKTGDVIGTILLDIKHDIISQSIQSITLGKRGFVFVIDDNRHVVYTPSNTITYRVNPNWMELEETPVTTRIEGEKYQIRHENSEYTGWKIVGVFSLDEIMGPINAILYVFISILIINLICIIVFSLKISQTITKPIIQLKRLMKRAEAGDLKVRFIVKHQDEVSELGSNFNQMLDRIELLIQMVYIEQQNKITAELKVLQEQIKPHFLYNTLDTINWMAREYGADDIVKVVDALTSMYRIGLSHGKDYVTLEEEIKYVSNYLYIQKIRYQTKLNYEIIEDVKLQGYEVPKLILQPLIENAIYHGIKTKRSEGHLLIITKELEGYFMELSVEDDGSGMSPEKVEELNRMLNEPLKIEENQSFGLFYIKERLRIRYGNRFSVQVISTKDIGTKVTIRIPQNSNRDDEDIQYE